MNCGISALAEKKGYARRPGSIFACEKC